MSSLQTVIVEFDVTSNLQRDFRGKVTLRSCVVPASRELCTRARSVPLSHMCTKSSEFDQEATLRTVLRTSIALRYA